MKVESDKSKNTKKKTEERRKGKLTENGMQKRKSKTDKNGKHNRKKEKGNMK